MDIGGFLLLIPLLFLPSLHAHGEDYLLMPVELAPIPCNDKAVEKLSRLAATYINEDRTEGYKFALNRIANVHLHAQVSAETRRLPPSFIFGVIGSERLLMVSQGIDVGAF